MMTKIKSLEQLQNERMRIRHLQVELEASMHDGWSDLKKCLRPSSIVENKVAFLRNKTRNKLRNESLLKSALLLGVTLVVKKFAENAEEKIADFFKEKLTCLQPKVHKQIEI